MNRAEELALKAYPDLEAEPFAYPNEIASINSANLEQSLRRSAFVKGFKAAGLTWQDIKAIDVILEKMIDEDIEGTLDVPDGDEAYYTEALKRFEKAKNQPSQ